MKKNLLEPGVLINDIIFGIYILLVLICQYLKQ